MILKRSLIGVLTFAVSAMMPLALFPQSSNCAPRTSIVKKLTEMYSETLTGGGLQNANTMLEVWSSKTTGSFTVLLSHANGISCIVSSGQDWNSIAAAMVPEGQAS